MADKRGHSDRTEPTLELPKLFGGRRRRSDAPVSPGDRSRAPSPAEDPQPLEVTAPDASTRFEGPLSDEDSQSPATKQPGNRKARRAVPVLPPRVAALVTGAVVGSAGTLLTYAALRGCETLTGTGSCGEGPGFLLLVAIVAVMVLVGGALLRLWRISDPQSTSFLAVGITAVVVMLTLLEAVFSPWMFLAVPLVTMAAYLTAHWVTTR